MKKAKLIYLLLIALCCAAFMGYRALDAVRTDTKPPEIQVNGQLSLSVMEPREALLQGVSAKDARDGDVTASLVVESIHLPDKDSAAKVVYAAFDKAGNVAKAEREVMFTDYVGPRLSLLGPLVFGSSGNMNVLDRIAASDALDGDISRRVRATPLSEESISTLGIHDVQFKVTNSLGDSYELVLPVEVYPSNTYKAELTLTDYLVYISAGSNFNARDYLYEFTMLNDTTYLRGTFPEELKLKITGKVDTNVPGVYAVSYTVTADRWNEPYVAYSKLIVIVEG